jgi:hypothetical protein
MSSSNLTPLSSRLTRVGLTLLCTAGLAVALASNNACSVVVSGDAPQCTNDSECTARGADFRDTRCNVQTGLCEATQAQLFADGDCRTNADCQAKGPDFVCSQRGNRCISWKSEDCQRVVGNPTEEGTLLVGLMSELGRNDFRYFREGWHYEAAQLALKHFQDDKGIKLPGDHKVAIVACTQNQPRRTAAHLAELGVKAVVGPSEEPKIRNVAETLIPVQVPLFTGWAAGNPAGVLPGANGLVWITSFFRPEVVEPLSALLQAVETRLRAADPTITRLRVATLYGVNLVATYEDSVKKDLRYNGDLSPLQQSNDTYLSISAGARPREEVDAIVNQLATFKPHVIIPFADIEWGGQYLGPIEDRLGALPAKERPVYLQPFLNIEDQTYRDSKYSGNTDFANRSFGIRPKRDTALEFFFEEFARTFEKSSGRPLAPPGAARAYETTLFVLYAMYAAALDAKGGFFAPQDVAKALPRITDEAAQVVRSTRDEIDTLGITTLRGGRNINLNGLFTTFQFPQGSSNARAQWEIWCAKPDLSVYGSGKVFERVEGRPGAFVVNRETGRDGCPTL